MSKSGLVRQGVEPVRRFFQPPEDAAAEPTELLLPAAPQSGKRMTASQRAIQDKKSSTYAKAYEEGYALGYAAGEQEGIRDGYETGLARADEETRAARGAAIGEFVDSLRRAVANADAAMKTWYEQAELEIGDLVADLAGKILEQELRLGREVIVEQCRKAMAEITHASRARIRCNPADSAIVAEHLDEIRAAAGSVREIDIVDDATISGGCAIETEGGLVEATHDNKLKVYRSALREAA